MQERAEAVDSWLSPRKKVRGEIDAKKATTRHRLIVADTDVDGAA